MLVTKREQQIIDEIVKKGQVSIADLLDVVGDICKAVMTNST